MKFNIMQSAIVRSAVLAAIGNFAAFSAVKSEEILNVRTDDVLVGHWVGGGDTLEAPYTFHNVNCESGRFATAIRRADRDVYVYFGEWETDGATIVYDAEKSGFFDRETLSLISVADEDFLNVYHLVEVTEARMLYEWRGEVTRRFEAQKTNRNTDESRWLRRLACESPPPVS